MQRVSSETAEPPGGAVAFELEERIRALRGGGQPLSQPDRAFFETRMGADFGAVRIHRGKEASALAQALGARAFAVGQDVAIANREPDLRGHEGRRLLAHELTHVVQQGAARVDGAPTAARAPVAVQRQEDVSTLDVIGAAAFGGASGLAGLAWLGLSRSQKEYFIDAALEQAAGAVRALPEDPALGVVWPLFKAGLEGLVARLRSPAVTIDEKIEAMNKLARILAGRDTEFTLAYLKGLAHGFFIDGMLGIFILIYDLLKAMSAVWGFLEQVGAAIQGFPDEINALIVRFVQIYEAIVADSDSALEEVKKWASDPKRVLDLLASAGQAVLDVARTKGGDLGEGLVKAMNQPGSAKALGGTAGSLTGTILWEVLFAVLTAGGGAAVTAAKTGLRTALGVVKKFVGRVVGGFLKLFGEIRAAFSVVGGWIRKAAKAIKGKFASISERLAKLLDDIGEFFAMLLRNCHESKLRCKLPGARRPGTKSRFTQGEIAKEIAEETGKVPAGQRALAEAGVASRAARKVEEFHHLLVQQLRKWFKARGVDIDSFTVKLSADEHRWIHNEYKWNDLWKDFMRKNPKASPAEIIAQMQELQKQVGLEGLEVVPYPRSR